MSPQQTEPAQKKRGSGLHTLPQCILTFENYFVFSEPWYVIILGQAQSISTLNLEWEWIISLFWQKIKISLWIIQWQIIEGKKVRDMFNCHMTTSSKFYYPIFQHTHIPSSQWSFKPLSGMAVSSCSLSWTSPCVSHKVCWWFFSFIQTMFFIPTSPTQFC